MVEYMILYDPLCPDCGGEMRLRRNKETHESFWGCAEYPECKGTRSVEVRAEDRPEDRPDNQPDEMPSDRYRRADKNRWRE
jgi:ssDNA-binding Zn-finger/Zn-ribbon topoisomerase 1